MKLWVAAIFALPIFFGASAFADNSPGRAIKPTRQIIEECIHRQKAAEVSKLAMIKNCREELRQQRTLESRRPEPEPTGAPRS